MSVYGNIVTENSKTSDDIFNEMNMIYLEMKNMNNFCSELIDESADEILNEFNLGVLVKKFIKNSKFLQNLKKKNDEYQAQLKKEYEKTHPNKYKPEGKPIKIAPGLYEFNGFLIKSLKFYKESNKILDSIDKELKSILSNSNNIDIDKLKNIEAKIKDIDLSKIDTDPKRLGDENIPTVLEPNGTTEDLEREQNLRDVQRILIREVQPICIDCLKEQKKSIEISTSINETILSFLQSVKDIDGETNECIKQILDISKNQLEYTNKSSYTSRFVQFAWGQACKLKSIIGETEKDLAAYFLYDLGREK